MSLWSRYRRDESNESEEQNKKSCRTLRKVHEIRLMLLNIRLSEEVEEKRKKGIGNEAKRSKPRLLRRHPLL